MRTDAHALAAAFLRFGPSHWGVLVSTVLIAALLVLIAGVSNGPSVQKSIRYGLAGILFANELAAVAIRHGDGKPFFQQGLPLQFCDFATMAAILALCCRWQLPYELAYFWGLGGSLEALITPDLAFDFPDIRFVNFFAGHAGVIVAVLFLTLATKMRPWPSSILRAFAGSQVYLALAAMVDWLAEANYGYLRAKPAHPSLIDYLGPWPFYLIGLEGIALLSFVICYLPFVVSDALANSRHKRTAPG